MRMAGYHREITGTLNAPVKKETPVGGPGSERHVTGSVQGGVVTVPPQFRGNDRDLYRPGPGKM
jgi:hypothetical protein